MAFKLTTPPTDERARELWLQHAAGFIVFEDIRKYALEQIPANIDDTTKKLVEKGIDDAVYGLMMIMDGVTGSLSNEEYVVTLENNIKLERNGETIQVINTLEGDGMCMGFHGWKDNDFGEGEIIPAVSID